MKCSFFNVIRQVCLNSRKLTRSLLLAGVLGLGTLSTADAAPITWHGNNGTNPTFWDIGTTPNWNTSTTNYAEGDAVTFDGTAVGYVVSVQTTVNPLSMTINSATAYSFSGGNINGATSLVQFGAAMATFSNNTLGFSGGTQLTNSGDITYSPTTGGAKSFGSAPIQLNNAGALFIYTPTTAGSTLTNDFVINAPVTWDRQSTNGTRTGTVTVNSNFNMRSDGAFPSVMENNVLLTADRTITGSLYFNIPTISGQVTSSGVKRSLTISNTGDNPGWFFDISSPGTTAWDIKDLVLNDAGNREATTRVTSDERNFFTSMEANGGYLRILTAGVQFARAANAEIGFDIIIKPQTAGTGTEYGTGIRGNTSFTVVSGGGLHGTGIYRSGAPSCCNGGGQEFKNPLDVTLTGTGMISPGDPTAVNTAGVLTLTGNLAFSGGELRIDVLTGNGVAGTDFDRLVVQDSLVASGRGSVSGISSANLIVDFHNVSFTDLEGDTIVFLTSSLTNFGGQQFGSVTGLNTNGFYFSVVYGAGFIELTNFTSTIPEPSTFALLGLGVLGMAVKARRRRRAAA